MSTTCDMTYFKHIVTSINNSVNELVIGQTKLIEKVNNLENMDKKISKNWTNVTTWRWSV